MRRHHQNSAQTRRKREDSGQPGMVIQCDTQIGVRMARWRAALLPRPGMAGDVGKWASQTYRVDRAGQEEGSVGMPI